MNVGKVKKQGRNLLCAYDEGGCVKSGEDALAVWKSHFETVLGGGGEEGGLESSCNRVVTDNSILESSERLCELIFREEILWAINGMRKDASPGMDSVVMDMIGSERLFEVW